MEAVEDYDRMLSLSKLSSEVEEESEMESVDKDSAERVQGAALEAINTTRASYVASSLPVPEQIESEVIQIADQLKARESQHLQYWVDHCKRSRDLFEAFCALNDKLRVQLGLPLLPPHNKGSCSPN